MIESLVNNRDDIVGYVKFYSNYKNPEKSEGVMYLHEDGAITIDPLDNRTLQHILGKRIGRFGEYYTAKDDPLGFLEYLHKYYRGSYFRASEFKRVKGIESSITDNAKRVGLRRTSEERKSIIRDRTATYKNMESTDLTKKRDEVDRAIAQEKRAIDPVNKGLRHQVAISTISSLSQEHALIERELAHKWGRPKEARMHEKRFWNMMDNPQWAHDLYNKYDPNK